MDFKSLVFGDKAINVAVTDADKLMAIIADKETAIGTLKAELADALSKVLTDEQLAAKVSAMADAATKREAVRAKFGDEAIKDASDAEIAGMYRVIGDTKDDTARKTIADMKAKTVVTDNGHQSYVDRLANAWKGE
jgi:hypothetical protein